MRNKFPWATLSLFYAIGLVRCVDWFIIGALLTPIKNELHLPDPQLGQIGAVFFVASSFTSPIFGYLGDRFPHKPLMLVALTIWNVAAVGCGLTSSLAILLIWRALVGLGQGCYETLLPGWLGDTFKPGWWSLVFGIIQSTAPVGAAIGFLVGSYLSAQLNWHYAFILTGAPGILLTIAFMFSREPQRGQSEEEKTAVPTPLFNINFAPATTLASELKATGEINSVLDLGAGSGVWGIVLAEHFPQARVTAVDFPVVLEVTKETAEKHGVADRFSFSPGDLLAADLGDRHDVAVLGHIIHTEGEKRSRQLLQKVFNSVAPGGTVAIAEWLVNKTRTAPPHSLMFAVNMLVHSNEGDTFSFDEIGSWLSEAGFRDPRLLDAPGVSPLILATKKK